MSETGNETGRLEGKAALVTGTSSGLGRATAVALARARQRSEDGGVAQAPHPWKDRRRVLCRRPGPSTDASKPS